MAEPCSAVPYHEIKNHQSSALNLVFCLQISCDRAYLSKAGGRGKQAHFEDPGGDLALGRDLGGEMSYSFNA